MLKLEDEGTVFTFTNSITSTVMIKLIHSFADSFVVMVKIISMISGIYNANQSGLHKIKLQACQCHKKHKARGRQYGSSDSLLLRSRRKPSGI